MSSSSHVCVAMMHLLYKANIPTVRERGDEEQTGAKGSD